MSRAALAHAVETAKYKLRKAESEMTNISAAYQAVEDRLLDAYSSLNDAEDALQNYDIQES